VNTLVNIEFNKVPETSLLAERLAASRDGQFHFVRR
jgi:hypothetical protein